jgi:hypothetical protein
MIEITPTRRPSWRKTATRVTAFSVVTLITWAMSDGPLRAQTLEGQVVQNPDDTVTYTIDLTGPPTGPGIKAFVLPLLDPNWVLPGTFIGPLNWTGQVVLAGSTFWNFNAPPLDLKSIYNNPPYAILFQSPDPLIGGPLSGFEYTSTQLPVFGPAQLQDNENNLFTIDPPLPGPIAAIPEPSTIALATLGLLSLGMTRRRRRR